MTRTLVFAVLISTALSLQASAATIYYVTVDGVKQGVFKGELTTKQHHGQIPAIGFDYSLTTPRDPATGRASGRRQYTPITMIKEWGASSPQFLTALITNEVLKTVTFDFTQVSANGVETPFYRITLTNALVSSIRQFAEKTSTQGTTLLDDSQPSYQLSGNALHELEAIAFTFEKIEVEDLASKTSATDEWSTLAP